MRLSVKKSSTQIACENLEKLRALKEQNDFSFEDHNYIIIWRITTDTWTSQGTGEIEQLPIQKL